MRILHLISSAGFYGAEAAVANLTLGLRRSGCDAAIGSLRNARRPSNEFESRLESLGLPLERVPCAAKWDPATVRWIREYVARHGVQVIHTHGYKADLHGFAASRGGASALLATCHNWTGENLRGRFYDFVDRLALRGFPRIAAVSAPVRDRLRRCGVPAGRIRVIPNGIDLSHQDEGPAHFPPFDPEGRPVVGFVGRLVPEKGVDVLLRSAAEVARSHTDALFVVVGEGPARPALEQLSRELGLASHVRFTGRATDMNAVYAALDVLVLPSRNEGAPMTVLEAMAARRPVVATRVGGLPELVADGETGILVPPDDADSLTAALRALLSDAGLRSRMGSKGRSRAETNFSCESMARQYLDLYQSALRECPC